MNTAFASQTEPDDPLDPAYPLLGGHDYYFCFWIGPRHPHAMDAVDVTLPDLPLGTRLQVALFDYEGEVRVTPAQDVGEIEIQDDLSVKVLRCAARPVWRFNLSSP